MLTILILFGQVCKIYHIFDDKLIFFVFTGYFTSRPALKGYTRVMNSLLQTCKQAEVLGEIPDLHRHTNASSVTLQLALGVDQHHDAVS